METFVVVYNLLMDCWRVFGQFKNADLSDDDVWTEISKGEDVLYRKYRDVDAATERFAKKVVLALTEYMEAKEMMK